MFMKIFFGALVLILIYVNIQIILLERDIKHMERLMWEENYDEDKEKE